MLIRHGKKRRGVRSAAFKSWNDRYNDHGGCNFSLGAEGIESVNCRTR